MPNVPASFQATLGLEKNILFFLSHFAFSFEYVPGSSADIKQADGLSRIHKFKGVKLDENDKFAHSFDDWDLRETETNREINTMVVQNFDNFLIDLFDQKDFIEKQNW